MTFEAIGWPEFAVDGDQPFYVTADQPLHRPAEPVQLPRIFANTIFVRETMDRDLPRLK